MEEVRIAGVDLTQQVFQVHGAAADGRFVSQETVAGAISEIMAGLRPCVVAMEACSTANYWGRKHGP